MIGLPNLEKQARELFDLLREIRDLLVEIRDQNNAEK